MLDHILLVLGAGVAKAMLPVLYNPLVSHAILSP